MNVSRTLRLAPLLVACALPACVWLDGGDGPDENAECIGAAGTPEPMLDQYQVAVAGSALRLTASLIAWAYEPPALGWASASCVTVTGGDADADGFPDAGAAGNVSLDSCQRPAFGGSLALSGSATVDDSDDGALASFAHTGAGAFSLSGGGFDAATWTFSDAGGDATGYYGLHTAASLGTAGDGILDAVLMYEVDAAYDPTTTWTPGTPLAAGTLTLDGPLDASFPFPFPSAHGEVVTAVPLTVDPACPERITDGEIRAFYATYETDDPCFGPSWALWELSVVWTGCGRVVATQSFDHSVGGSDPYP